MLKRIVMLSLALMPVSFAALAQCMIYPVSLDERVQQAVTILTGTVTVQHCYLDAQGNIYTANKIGVEAWLKGQPTTNDVYVITVGGAVNGKAQISFPAVQLTQGQKYFLMLEGDNFLQDDKQLRPSGALQAMPVADLQGAWPFQQGKYIDALVEAPLTEAGLFQRLQTQYGLQARNMDGSVYVPSTLAGRTSGVDIVTSFGPNPTNAGTVNPSDFLTINGSGFGNVPGTVQFPNADNGGSTFITPPNASDYVTWTDNTIVVKVPTALSANAGTGNFIVTNSNGTQSFTSPQPLVIRYSHISINSTFSGFATPTRLRYYLRNMDGQGGYTFLYNTNFQNNPAAIAAFERALVTWTCQTGINWRTAGITTNGYADDDQNVLQFDATLPAGVLARATSRFSGSSVPGTCDMQNTVWWMEEIDLQVRSSNVSWQFGPALASGSQYDFETVILHELGHAHGLGHRIAPGELMNYTVSNATNIRTPAPQEVQGGIAKVSYSSSATCFNPTGSGTPMIVAGCPFPVTLYNFTGHVQDARAFLKWTTLTEVNTVRFDVQHSTDGLEFITAGSVKAAGYAVTEQHYQFQHLHMQPGENYYRLKIIDADGSFEYSSTIRLRLNDAGAAFQVFPNPVRDQLQVRATQKALLNLTDASGRVLQRIQLNAGVNRIDLGRLAAGIYYLVDPSSTWRNKILKMP